MTGNGKRLRVRGIELVPHERGKEGKCFVMRVLDKEQSEKMTSIILFGSRGGKT
jgi:hypothetical protein